MELAKITSKGQITLPVAIRRRLGLNTGDKVAFIETEDGIVLANPDSVAIRQDATPKPPATPKKTAKAAPATDIAPVAPVIESSVEPAREDAPLGSLHTPLAPATGRVHREKRRER